MFTFQQYKVDKLDIQNKRPKPPKKKGYPMESHQGISVNNPWTSPSPKEEAPQHATMKTASPLAVNKTNVS